MHALHSCFLHDLCVWNFVLSLDFQQLSQTTEVGMVKPLCMTLVYCLDLTCIQESLQYKSLEDFQLGVKLDYISLPESSECHTGVCNSGSDVIISVYCSGESAFQVGEFIVNFQFLSIHSDGWFTVRLSRCWFVYNLCLFADCEIIFIT